jgi:Tfp pilus assembly protein PilX
MFLADCPHRRRRGGRFVVSLLMLAVVALFPVVLLALLLLTSGLEGRVADDAPKVRAGGPGTPE